MEIVGPDQIKEQPEKLSKDLVLTCCSAVCLRPYVSEEAKRFGKLTVLPVRINPDLLMGGDLLKTPALATCSWSLVSRILKTRG